MAYEAGPTGFGLSRALTAAGVGCVIAAPGKIERPATDRVKTDQRDAERLVRLLMIDGLHAVRVPGNEEEAIRDLVRARDAYYHRETTLPGEVDLQLWPPQRGRWGVALSWDMPSGTFGAPIHA